MSDWNEIVGNFESMHAPKVSNTVLGCFYKTVLRRREQLTTDAREVDNDFEDPHSRYLNFDEERQLGDAKAKEKPKFQYLGEVTEATEPTETTEEDSKVNKKIAKTKKKIMKNKTKWYTASAEFRSTMGFLLVRYVKEVKDFYTANGNKFPEENDVLSEFTTFAANPIDIGSFYIAPFIFTVTDKIDVNKVVEPIYEDLDTLLQSKLKEIFKNNEGSPTRQINKLVDRWIQFIKLIAVNVATVFWYSKGNCNAALVSMVLRQLVLQANREASLDEMFFKTLDEYNVSAAELLKLSKNQRKVKAEAANAVTDETAPATEEQDDFSKALEQDDSISQSLDAQESNDWEEEATFDEQ